MINYYRTLGLSPDATEADIKRAYRTLAKRFHPDVSNAPDARARFIEVNEAYEFLSDPRRRQMYGRRTVSEQERMRREAVYRQWAAQQQQQARDRARRYAERSMDDFVNSPMYKTAMVLSQAYNYIFIGVGVVMTFGPAVRYLLLPDAEIIKAHLGLGGVFLPMGFGVLFTFGIYSFLFKPQTDDSHA